MVPESESQAAVIVPPKRRVWRALFLILTALVAATVIGLVAIGISLRPSPPIQMALGDGRVLQIEGVTFGTQHRMGRNPLLERFRPWLPGAVSRRLGGGHQENNITLDRPGIVVWVDAISASSGTNVDCQGIRVEFTDRNGDLFGQDSSSWFGGQTFWRVGHIFYCYPRDERELTLRVTTWKQGKTSTAKIANPRVVQAATWSGKPLPQSTNVGGMEIILSRLEVRTNGVGKKSYYETAAEFFEPALELRQNGKTAVSWAKPEWVAEDPNGNRGRFLGVHQPALRFFIAAYPEATNLQTALLIATLPQANLSALNTNLWWNQTNSLATKQFVVLGLFLPGTHTFSQGNYESSSTAVLGPRGGSPSGWTGMSRRTSPMRVKQSHSHYTPNPVLYIQANLRGPNAGRFDYSVHGPFDGSERLAVRLRDDHGQYWLAKSESSVDGINPFLIELPPGVTKFVAEVVLLKPVQADFLVETKNYLRP